MKKLLALVLAVVMTFAVGTVSFAEEAAAGLSGEGTAENPYLIKTVEDLEFFKASVNAGETTYNTPGVWVALGADIDLAGKVWTEGIGDGHNWSFDGYFDGKGYTIKNLNMKPYADDYGYVCGGLFGYTWTGVIIRNLTLENVTIDCTDIERVGNPDIEPHNVGALIGFVSRSSSVASGITVENITVKGDIRIDAPNVEGVGVIAGYTYRYPHTFTNCKVVANNGSYVKGHTFVGGIAGYSFDNSTYTGCSVENIKIEAIRHYAGGIAGLVNGGNKIEGCKVAAEVVSNVAAGKGIDGSVVGGLGAGAVTIVNTEATGIVLGGSYSDGKEAFRYIIVKDGDAYDAKGTIEEALAVTGATIYVNPANTELAETLFTKGYAVDKTTGVVSHFHIGEWAEVTEATCKADGTEKRICSACGAEEERTVKGDHNYENGVCGTCGDERKEVEVAEPATKTEVSDEIAALPNYVQAEVTAAAEATKVEGLEKEAEKVAESLTEEDVEEIIEAAIKDENIKIENPTTVVVEPEVKISVEDYKPAEEGKAPVLVLDIEPVINVYVANDTEKELYKTEEVNTAGQEVVVTIELPEGFAEEGSVLYVLHTKEDGTQYEYKCVVEDGKISFVNKNGFSTFEVSTESNLVTVTFVARGKVISQQEIICGTDAVVPAVPSRAGYNGYWNHDGKNITEDTEITAIYEKVPETVEVVIDATKDYEEPAEREEEQNPNTGAPVMMPVLAVVALGAAVLSKRK